jgi:hypothetical protein
MFPPGFACVMPEIPPPGGILQAPPPPTCGRGVPPGSLCVWPEGEAISIEVIGIGSANPNEPIYTYQGLLILPGPDPDDFDVPVVNLVTVLNYQRNMTDPRFCGTGNEHNYWESAFWFETDECPGAPPQVRR